MGHGMPRDQRHQLHRQALGSEMPGGNQSNFLRSPRSKVRQDQPKIISGLR